MECIVLKYTLGPFEKNLYIHTISLQFTDCDLQKAIPVF